VDMPGQAASEVPATAKIAVAPEEAPCFNQSTLKKPRGDEMNKYVKLIALVGLGMTVSIAAQAQSSKRTELTKGDLTGKNMDIVVGIVEVPPGASGVLHTHPGEEAYYVIDGATGESPDGKPVKFEAGTAAINPRGFPHGAFKITGDKTLKLLTVHIVDKGQPMMQPVK
jgi:quercetin dioxygenase-like cupin family protein